MYDGVVRINQPETVKLIVFQPETVKLIVYADNLMVIAVAKHTRQWFSSSLILAEHKTEVLLINTRRVEERISLTIGECEIQ